MKIKQLAVIVAASVSFCSFAQDAATARKAIEGRYAEYVKAIKSKNLKAIMSLSTADRTYKTKEGQVHKRADIEKNIGNQFKAIKSYDDVKFTIKDFKLTGKEAIVTVTSAVKAKIIMTPDGKKTGALETKTESRVWWISTDKGWLIKKTEVISDSQMLDGKPIVKQVQKGKPGG